MYEGWHEDEYLILFTEEEVLRASGRYAVATLLPGYQVIGLRGWDDFIVRDRSGEVFTVPTVPCEVTRLRPYRVATTQLTEDVRFAGKIKWYEKPLVFGGDAAIGPNLMWVTHDQHAQLVQWWNDRYRALAANAGSG